MNKKNRRDFIKNTAGTAAAVSLIGTSAKWAGANEKINIGVVGIRSRGQSHISGFGRIPETNVVALCDADGEVLQSQAKKNSKIVSPSVELYKDYRQMLENKDIDAIAIATPNHWHCLMTIWACQADKDVYVEKPMSHNIYEGRKTIEAARKYKRVVQHGTQSRSSDALQEAMEHLKNKTIGDIYYAKGTCYKWRKTISKKPPQTPPADVDYNLWLGPAPDRPFTENRFHYNWHWHWDYGNGDIGNQGVHEMDIARWGLESYYGKKLDHPYRVNADGDHFMFEDDQETPNTLVSTFRFPDVPAMFNFEVRHWISNVELHPLFQPGQDIVGNLFLGSEGILMISWYNKYQIFMGKGLEPGPKREGKDPLQAHFQNFVDCIKTRKDPNATVEDGHYSSVLCHLANAAYLAEETIKFDPKTEACTNNEKANAYLQGTARNYRAPFVIPSTI
jgi:predicted dehydrogenase